MKSDEEIISISERLNNHKSCGNKKNIPLTMPGISNKKCGKHNFLIFQYSKTLKNINLVVTITYIIFFRQGQSYQQKMWKTCLGIFSISKKLKNYKSGLNQHLENMF